MDNNDLKKWLAEQISYLEKTKEQPEKFAWDLEYDFQLAAFRMALERLEPVALDRLQPVRLDGDGSEAFALAAEVSKLRYEMEKLKAERDSARHNLETVQKMVQEYQEEIVPGYRERAEKAEAQRDAAIKEMDEVAAAVDDFSDFVDEEVHPVVDYNLYLSLRENADAISMWQYEEEWRGQKEE